MADAVGWAQARGVIVASDECYVEFNWDEAGEPRAPGATALAAGVDGVLAVHSLSKRSNMAGYRCGFLAGDGDLVAYVGSIRTHAGMMVPGPIQAAAAAAWNDDAHVDIQRARYAERRRYARSRLAEAGLVDAGGPSSFYLWARSADPHRGRLGRHRPAGRDRACWSPPATSTVTAAPTTSASPWSSRSNASSWPSTALAPPLGRRDAPPTPEAPNP